MAKRSRSNSESSADSKASTATRASAQSSSSSSSSESERERRSPDPQSPAAAAVAAVSHAKELARQESSGERSLSPRLVRRCSSVGFEADIDDDKPDDRSSVGFRRQVSLSSEYRDRSDLRDPPRDKSRYSRSSPRSQQSGSEDQLSQASDTTITRKHQWSKRVTLSYRKHRLGLYMPPYRQKELERAMAKAKMRRTTEERQQITWLSLLKGLNGLVNRVTNENIQSILPGFFEYNLVRGKGLLVRALMKAQVASVGYTPVYAAIAAVINTKLPEVGELLVSRVVVNFRQALQKQNKPETTALVRFIAHLVNQQVAHDLLALEVIHLLLARPTDDSVEVAIEFTKQVGEHLGDSVPSGMHVIFEQFRTLLQEGMVSERVQYMIENLFEIRKKNFDGYPAILKPNLDLVEENDRIVHEIGLDDELDPQDYLNKFTKDSKFKQNEMMWKSIQKEILGGVSSSSSEDDSKSSGSSGSESDTESSGGSSDSSASEDSFSGSKGTDRNAAAVNAGGAATSSSDAAAGKMEIEDLSESELVALRRNIYLTIMSSLTFEEAAHKLIKLQIPRGRESELANMIIECCSQEKTFNRYHALIAQRLCRYSRVYQECFMDAFAEQYKSIHRLETNMLRNVAKLFAHLLSNDALPWTVFENVHMNERETTPASRIFVKFLCQDMAEEMGTLRLRGRFLDPDMTETFRYLLPMGDNLQDTRFAINFFTMCGLGPLTDNMRTYFKNAPRTALTQPASRTKDQDSSSDSESSSSGSDAIPVHPTAHHPLEVAVALEVAVVAVAAGVPGQAVPPQDHHLQAAVLSPAAGHIDDVAHEDAATPPVIHEKNIRNAGEEPPRIMTKREPLNQRQMALCASGFAGSEHW
eukprot:CAMPEP_0171544508 /NCGR_PEP_ID=MMETSP0960-20121227/3542_1 /TAXON_ID=87120 /ORGANISM="Aurantiochytrium limacinum, Strain ATCCMYA-1381" /LENGTH=868 /DNA_ID=CAMNT_0012092329 /DNA_START=249 /DNA_END=2853 /DNA_ORIENTATION=+